MSCEQAKWSLRAVPIGRPSAYRPCRPFRSAPFGPFGPVFECLVDPGQWAGLRASLLGIADAGEDSLRFYFLGSDWKGKVEHHGAKPAWDPEGPLVV